MRISFLVPRCTPDNSHGRYFIELSKRFSDEHDVTVYAGAFWNPLRSVVRCQFMPVPNRPAVVRLGALWAASFMTGIRAAADIVHVNGADAPIGNVVTAQCCNAVMRTAGHGPGFLRKLNYSIGVRAEKYCLSKMTTRRVIAISNQVGKEIVKEYGVDPRKVTVVYHGVDLDTFHPQNRIRWRSAVCEQLHLEEGQFLVLFVGGDYRLKGLLPLLEAAKRVGRIRVIGVGITPDSELRRVVDENAYAGLVSFVANTSEIAKFYAAADSFVLPTLYDTFSMATLEAMASGLPTIVSRRAGVSELVTHGHDCLVLEDPRDIETLALHLGRLLGDESLRMRLAIGARTTAEQYSWDRIAQRTFQVYEETLMGTP
jgi:UDP-glucose:(heptosyl)LPS alpha-1,3-glucosyltransferase